jgi:hypothetical protein
MMNDVRGTPVKEQRHVQAELTSSPRTRRSGSVRRWVTASLATLGVGAVLVGVSQVASGEAPDPGSAAAASRATPAEVLQYMEKSAHAAFGDRAPADSATSVLLDEEYGRLTPAAGGEATSMYVQYGKNGQHTWKLFLGTSDGALPEAGKACADLSEATLSCEAQVVADGEGVAVTSVIALASLPDPSESGEVLYTFATREDLSRDDLSGLKLELNTRVFWQNGAMTSATESVVAPDSLDTAKAFASSPEELAGLAVDTHLADLWGSGASEG